MCGRVRAQQPGAADLGAADEAALLAPSSAASSPFSAGAQGSGPGNCAASPRLRASPAAGASPRRAGREPPTLL
eukprot:5401699-Pyramimonas_sp.AAC.1